MDGRIFYHVAVFRWVPGKAPDVEALSRELDEFVASLPGIRSYACGPDVGIRDGSVDFAVSATFETEEDVRRYLSDPTHHAIVAKHLADAAHERHSVQFHGM